MKPMFIAVLLLLTATAQAEPAAADKGCIDVQVGQARALAYDCLTRHLQNPEGQRAAQENRRAMQMDVSRKAPNQLGLSTPSATSTRMGNTFGTSAYPQRPAN
ncbi:hypothetical protein [Pseudomonas fontis]|uniref:Secreted protein n=1 Tax=Pseudomonas fontis TaxID=2942633 RepID=A0ABT5NPV8_9PSED|nr:hypothetical protein [Pseudomonas fontis]MDD0974700.1 hypothetical protein [Pseudomonas fontis]MDD0990195.1 hypothetical protein [Pseudomonas fontis]